IRIDVDGAKGGILFAAIDVAAGDTGADAVIGEFGFGQERRVMGIFDDRVKIASAFRTGLKMMGAFAQTPAVVAAFDDEIDLFPFVLADVPGPHVARLAVPTESPGIA